jgi:cytochrome o ubiquinol oxidase subunit 2
MKRHYIVLVVAFAVIVGWKAFFYLRTVGIPVLQPAGDIAAGELRVIIITLLLSGIVVIPVFVLLFYFAWKYRANSESAHEHHDPNWDHDSKAAELIWWLVPSVIIIALSVIMWQSSQGLDPYKQLTGSGEGLTVEVVALDWKWLFIYPQYGIASVNMLEFPENRSVHFLLTADAPMNSFWIPSLGGQIMVMPGMTTQLNLRANKLGNFNGFSGNISGKGFAGMSFTARSVSNNDFQNWVQSIQQSPSPLMQSEYDALAASSEYNSVAYYAPIDSNLFANITMKFMMPSKQTSSNTTSSAGGMQMSTSP